MMGPIGHCKDCRYWNAGYRGDVGQCRLSPPTVIETHHLNREYTETVWPETKENEWCGQYEGKESRSRERPW